LLNNVGEYLPESGIVDIVAIQPQALLFGVNYIKVSVTPENQSVVKPLRNYILNIDPSRSSATALIDRQTTSLEIDA
jgi:hypothetical protein